ncbi:MAG: NAD-dependent epimerase/dehydratase family protein [Patescibacteria group bacterium]
MDNKHSKIIVTGGAGFIGSHLTDELVKLGFEVHIIDNLSTGRKENLNPAAKFHNLDIRNLESIKPVFNKTKYVFHMAALARVQPSIQDPKTYHDINTSGTFNVLMAARDAKVKRLIFSSSSSVYGEQKVFPLKENFAANPLSPYGLQKYMGELKCGIFSKIYNLETVCLRYFTAYGPRLHTSGAYSLAIGKFLGQRRQGQPMTVTGTGRQSRDFTSVYDIVRANILAMRSSKVGKGEVINIGGGNDHSINTVARLIGGPVVYIKSRQEPKRTLADISLAKKLLGWKPQIKLEDGIKELKKIYLS